MPFEPAIHWVYAEDIEASYGELQASGAKIVEPLELKQWGLTQSRSRTWMGTGSTSTMTERPRRAG